MPHWPPNLDEISYSFGANSGAHIPVTDFERSRIAVGGLAAADLIGLAVHSQGDKILGPPPNISVDDLPVIIITGSCSVIHHNYAHIRIYNISRPA